MAVLLLAGCAGSGEEGGKLDYAALDELEYSLVTEIGESEDYLPGQISALAIDSRGHILAWDRPKVTIEQFDHEGNHLATVATEGNGPGEVVQNTRLVGVPGDTLVLNFVQANQYSLFAPGDDGVYAFLEATNHENPHSGSMNVQGSQSTDRHFLTTTSLDITRLGPEGPAYSRQHVDLVDRTHAIIRDSLHEMILPNPIIEMAGGGFTVYAGVPYDYQDVLQVFDDSSYLIARADSATLEYYSPDHEMQQMVELNLVERPLTEADRAYAFRNMDREVQEKMLPRLAETKPAFLGLWASEEYIWMHTDNSGEGREMVVLTHQGEPLGRFILAESERVHAVVGNRLYVVDNDSDRGSVIRIYEVDL
ncbi:MAG: hypothetical protein U5K31_04765 [Balneolaceae bacterium]|nr:hypothetical protein [Balneolaceae bacterium]